VMGSGSETLTQRALQNRAQSVRAGTRHDRDRAPQQEKIL
jgi:hypothetical protein